MKFTEHRIAPDKKTRLAEIDPDATPLVDDKQEARKRTEKTIAHLTDLQEVFYAERKHKVLIVLQGMDTSGKDGVIRHVMTGLNPMGVRIVSFKAPTSVELGHDFLWRAHGPAPASGEIAVFNRSHYEDVLVVRVHNLVPEAVWKKRYEQINEFERILADSGTIILKFFLHISPEEQRARLQARIDDPTKRWKFQPGDLDERKLWGDYMAAYEAMVRKTSTKYAPWYVVPANAKWYRNFVVGGVLERALDDLDLKFPEIDLSTVVVE